MKRILLFFILITNVIILYSQESPLGGFVGEVNSVIGPDSVLVFNIFDQSSVRSATNIDTNYVLWNACIRYEIVEVIASVNDQAFVVIDNPTATQLVPTTVCVILEESPEGIGHFISGASNGIQQCMASYYANIPQIDSLYTDTGLLLTTGDTIPSQRDTFFDYQGNMITTGDTLLSQRDTFFDTGGNIIVAGDTIIGGQVALTSYLDGDNVEVKVYHENDGIVITKPIRGRLNIIATDTHIFSISVTAQNDDLNGLNELIIYVEENNSNNVTRNYSVEIFDKQNNALVNQFLNGQITVQSQDSFGPNQLLFTIPNLNVFGAGFTIELR